MRKQLPLFGPFSLIAGFFDPFWSTLGSLLALEGTNMSTIGPRRPDQSKNGPQKTKSTATPSKPHHPPQPQTQMRSSIVLTRPGHSAICTAAEKPQKASKHHLKGGGGSGGSEEEFFCLTPDDVTRSRNASERSESAKHHQLPSSSRSGH